MENPIPSRCIAVFVCFARYSVHLLSFQCGPIPVSMKCCWYRKYQIFWTSLHFLMSFYFSFSILMTASYIDQKQVLRLDSLWIHQSTMRKTDMRNRKQKHGNTYCRHVPVLAKSLCVLVMPAFQQHVSAITVRNPEDSIAVKCA